MGSAVLPVKRMKSVSVLAVLLLVVASATSDRCCDHDHADNSCFHVRCEPDCVKYSPCQDRPCDLDSIGYMWCASSHGKRITEMKAGFCGAGYHPSSPANASQRHMKPPSGSRNVRLMVSMSANSARRRRVGAWTSTLEKDLTPQTASKLIRTLRKPQAFS